jgi:SH3-like domain-containing protein
VTTTRLILVAAAVLLVLATAVAVAAPAADENAATAAAALKLPRFVSLHADKVNLRTGPGRQYPIAWVLTRRDMPVEITAQFENWRRIREWDGTEGWVQEHMVDGKRFVVIEKGADRPLYAEPDPVSGIVARAEAGAVARLDECRGPWCRVAASGISGWLKRSDVWGVGTDENIQ